MAFVGIYRALYDYAPQSSEELEIKDGDLLFILDKSSDDDWWKCKKKAADDDDDEPEGLVPNNYVEEAKPTHTARALYDYTRQTDEELSFKDDARLDVYDETDPDWTLVGSNGEYGFAPTIYIEPVAAGGSAAAPAPSLSPAPPAMPPRPVAGNGPIPGEADYVAPSSDASASNPAAALASIIAQKTGDAQGETPSARRALASPPTPSRVQYTPEESEEEEAPPPKPARPQSQSLPSPQQMQSPSMQSPRVQSPPTRSQTRSEYIPSGTAEAPGIFPDDYDEPQRSPLGYHLYNIHEYLTHMGKNKKLPTTLGINVDKMVIMISPEKSKDGPSKEWTADKLQHYSIEGKHVFLELVRPSKSVDFHAGAKDTAQEIVAHLGELAGASRGGGGFREILAASAGTGAAGLKTGKMVYEFMAQGDDEVTVAAEDEVIVLDDSKSDEWWMVRRLRGGKEGVVPSSYVEITGTVPRAPDSVTGLNSARSTVEQNRLEEERLSKDAAKSGKRPAGRDMAPPERTSSLAGESSKGRSQRDAKRGSAGSAPKSKPNTARVRTWTDRSGTFKVEAEFIGLREGKIHLHKTNGVKIAVPVTKMAVEDLEYVEDATGASLDDDKPLSDIKRRGTQKAAKANGAGATIQSKDHDYWFDFFLQCGVNPQICERYASAFSRDQMGPESLPDINEQLLRTLGLKEGDILRVMKSLDTKFDRQRSLSAGAPTGAVGDEDKIEAVNGGLFSGPGGTLRNNTKKGRPAPAVQTDDVVDEDAFRTKNGSPSAKSPTEGARATPLTNVPAREPRSGFEDNAWDVKPARAQQMSEVSRAAAEPPRVVEPPKPMVNDDIASLSLTTPALQPTPAPAPAPPPAAQPVQEQQPQGADQAIFNKIAALAPARQRPQPPAQQPTGGTLGMQPPPPRASSAPGFNPNQQNSFGPPPLQPQLTGYNQQQSNYGPGQQSYQQGLEPQQTQGYPLGYSQGFQGQQNSQGYQGQQNGFPPQQTGLQSMQQNFPALQPQPTGLNFQPQSQFGQHQQTQHYGGPQQQASYQQQLVNGAQTGSPFADPPRQPYQPNQPYQPTPSGLQNSFTAAQPTGFQSQPQPNFNIAQPTGINGFQQPQFPPQQTGGVLGPPQSAGGGLQPLVAQKTGPAPPVRFGVQPGANKLAPQPTGRANLAKASKYICILDLLGDGLCDVGGENADVLQRHRIRSVSRAATMVGFALGHSYGVAWRI